MLLKLTNWPEPAIIDDEIVKKKLIAYFVDKNFGFMICCHNWYGVICREKLTGVMSVKYFGKKRKIIYLHRLIMGARPYQEVDHVNRNPLDNRCCNLRFCTKKQNGSNRGKNKNNKHQYKGTWFCETVGRWRAAITVDYKLIHLGYFNTKEEAALAYNIAAQKYFGEFACLNLIESVR